MENESQNGLTNPKSTPRKMPAWNKPFIWAGLMCIGQFFVFAIIGVIQGYSVQSRVPHWVLLGCFPA